MGQCSGMTLSDNSGVAVVVIASLFGTLVAIVWA